MNTSLRPGWRMRWWAYWAEFRQEMAHEQDLTREAWWDLRAELRQFRQLRATAERRYHELMQDALGKEHPTRREIRRHERAVLGGHKRASGDDR